MAFCVPICCTNMNKSIRSADQSKSKYKRKSCDYIFLPLYSIWDSRLPSVSDCKIVFNYSNAIVELLNLRVLDLSQTISRLQMQNVVLVSSYLISRCTSIDRESKPPVHISRELSNSHFIFSDFCVLLIQLSTN